MKEEFTVWFVGIVAMIAIFFGILWVISSGSLIFYKVFAPQYEQARRETFEQSKAYNQGMVQELQNMQFEYAKAPSSSRPALRKIILHRAADYPEEAMPPDLRDFIRQLKLEEAIP